VKATPAFNLALCTRFRVKPLEFDGRSDSIFHPSTRNTAATWSTCRPRRYADVPVEEIQQAFARPIEVLRLGPTQQRNVRAHLMRALLEESFRAAVGARTSPHPCSALPPPPKGRTFVAAAGKAAASMASPSRSTFKASSRASRSPATARPADEEDSRHRGGHPVPDEAGEAARARFSNV